MDGFSDFDGRSWSYSLRNPDLIMPGLYLGPLSACDILSLQKHGITHILRVISNTDHTPPSEITMMHIDLDDVPSSDLLTRFDDTHRFIADAISAGGTVLVHCLAGVSRSATIVIAYLMKEYGMNYKTARQLVVRARPIVGPNEGFEMQLQFYEYLQFSLTGDTPAHQSIKRFINAETGRLDAWAFMEKWGELSGYQFSGDQSK